MNKRVLAAIFIPLLPACQGTVSAPEKPKPQEVAVVAFTPQGELNDVDRAEVIFSGPVIPAEQVGQKLEEIPLAFVPALNHECKWESQAIIRCLLSGAVPGTEYQAELKPESALAGSGLQLAGDRRWKFRRAPFRIESVESNQDFEQIPPEGNVTLLFNYAAAPDEVVRHLKFLSPDNRELPFWRRTWENSRRIELNVRFDLFSEEGWDHITLKMNKDMPSADKATTLGQDYERRVDIKLGGELEVKYASPGQEERATYVSLRFASWVKPEKLQPMVVIDPHLDWHVETRYNELRLVGPFQPGQDYKLTLKAGLSSASKATLSQDHVANIHFPDLNPWIGLAGQGHYQPLGGAMSLGVETINLDKVQLRVNRVFAPNLPMYFGSGWSEDYYWQSEQLGMLGEEVVRKDMAISNVPNRIVTTPLPLGGWLDPQYKGLLAVMLYEEGRTWEPAAWRWVIATDLGITARRSGERLNVMVRSLDTLDAITGAEVELLSASNIVLGSGRTDARGWVQLDGLAEKFKRFQPALITARKGDDFSVLVLSSAQVNMAVFDVGGEDYSDGAYEAFLYGERDLCRPGETAHISAIVRDAGFNAPPPFPVRLELTAPDGRVYRRLQSMLDRQGTVEFAVPMDADAVTGLYSVRLLGAGDAVLGRLTLRIEEFAPDRMKVTVRSGKDRYGLAEDFTVDAEALYLFGPPVAEKPGEARCTLEPVERKFEGFADFVFANDRADPMRRMDIDLGEFTTDTEGKAKIACDLPDGLKPPSGLSGTMAVSVFEPGGGRAVTGYASAPVDPYPAYLGLRRDTPGEAGIGEPVRYSFVALDPSGAAKAGQKVNAQLMRIEWNSLLTLVDGRYQWRSEEREVEVSRFDLVSDAKPVTFEVTPATYGSYVVRLADPDGGMVATHSFSTWGWGQADWSMSHPDRLEIELDQPEYDAGTTAKVLVRAPFSGRLIVTVERDRLMEVIEKEMKDNTAEISLPVRADYGPNAHVVVQLIRSFRDVENYAPLRALGVAKLKVSSKPHRLAVRLEAPEEMRPNTEIEVRVRVPGGAGGRIALAAVDEGILALSAMASPDPLSHFHRTRRWPFQPYDYYAMILPEITQVAPRLPTGGDISQEARYKRQLGVVRTNRFVPVSLWSGWMDLDMKGEARLPLKVPQFNGTLRLMAVAASGARVGAASQGLRVREPVTLTSAVPRFLAPGDQLTLATSIYNGTGKTGEFAVALETDSAMVKLGETAPQRLNVEPDREGTAAFKATVQPSAGVTQLKWSAEGNGEKSGETISIAIRPPSPLITHAGADEAKEGAPLSFDFPDGWVEGSTHFRISISALPALKNAKYLRDLLRYPYGCIEQTASRGFALIYFNEIARLVAPDLFKARSADYFAAEAVRRIESMLGGDGRFRMWPYGGYYNDWSHLYATHFLIEARKAGQDVSTYVMEKSLDYADAIARGRRLSPDGAYSDRELGYALYVLSLGGRPNKGVLGYLKTASLEKVSSDTRLLIAAAYALAGDRAEAERILPQVLQPSTDPRENGGTFNSAMRANALMLSLLVDIQRDHPAVGGLLRSLSEKAEMDGYYTTQENAFSLMALGKYYQAEKNPSWTAQLQIGERSESFDAKGATFEDSGWGGESATLTVTGAGTAFVYWEATGIPADASKVVEADNGLQVRRTYLDEGGNPLDLNAIRQGDLLVVRIEAKALNQPLENVVISDLLPAGLEIENPRLKSSASIPWLEDTAEPQYMDVRDDRMLLFDTIPSYGARTFHYAARATSAGSFIVPPVRGEAMYDPGFNSTASSGRMTILPRE